ncbi:hypothetical protein [Desulfovibrio sp. TomC]|uniref:hypothetical protein n=1 Tax=Desulfovibrio sp. TomC TaxID=1562888 RepID=UPI00057590BD|nr:hypothetical protein [Desulfovibrio sp. TomC]KHK02066.1 hypothetical protein NY78_2550 [Desulfovibrio sp. TomC]
MADLIFTSFKEGLGRGIFNLPADTLRCALLTSAYVPSASHGGLADVAGFEALGPGYAAGGQTLGGVGWSASGGKAALRANDPAWTETTVTARYALIYLAKTAGGLTNPLVCLLDFGADRGVTGGTFTVRFDASGVLTLE